MTSRRSAPRAAAGVPTWIGLAGTLLVLAGLAPRALAQPADWPHPSELDPPPIEFDTPEPRRVVLGNGLVVHLAEDRSLPLVSGVAYVLAPGLYDPEELVGLAGFTATMLREGGAGGRAPAEVDLALERLAASVEAGAGGALASVSFSALSDTLDEVMPIWRDVLVAPDFDPERIEIQRERRIEGIRRIVDDPVQLAVREFQARVAEGHPTGLYPTEATIGAIERDDLVAFHEAYYGPATTILALTGDFDADAMVERLEGLFAGWDAPVEPPPDLPPFDETPERRVYLAPKDVQQSVIIVGTPAMRTYEGPYTSFTVANQVLGAGGFTSRLFEEIRTRRGLAYSTGAQLTEGFEVPGLFLAYAFTRADATAQVLELLLDEIERLREEGVAPEELDEAVTTLVNASVFRDTSVAAITERAARTELLGVAPDAFERHVERMQALTPDDVRAAAAEVIDPDHLVVLVVGDEDAFDRPLSEFGEVERIEIE